MRGKRQVAGIDGSFRGMKWGGADQRLHRVGYRARPLGDRVHLATAEHQNTRLNPNFDAS
jgi:hypothetical protein